MAGTNALGSDHAAAQAPPDVRRCAAQASPDVWCAAQASPDIRCAAPGQSSPPKALQAGWSAGCSGADGLPDQSGASPNFGTGLGTETRSARTHAVRHSLSIQRATPALA